MTHESVTEPLATGIFKKKILLPPIAFSDNELYFILLHEYIHLKKYDLFKKYIVDICCIFFWWIPFHEFVQRDIEQLIEIHCDLSIIQNTAEKKTYMEVLLNSVKHSAQQNHNKMVGSLSFAFKESPYSMTERFKLIVEKPHTKKWHNLVLIVIGSTLITLSYLLVPIPEYEPDPKEIELSGFTYITPDNTSLSIENGTYFLTTRDGTKLPVSANHAKHMIASGIKLQKGEE